MDGVQTESLNRVFYLKNMTVKKCSGCGFFKCVSLFYKNKSKPDGLNHYCKPCNLEAAKHWRFNNVKRANELSKEYQRNKTGYYERNEI